MKKIILFISFILVTLQSEAQFVNAIGVTAGVGFGNQKFMYTSPAALSRKNYIFRFNCSVMAEFLSRDYVRWVSELQFDQKGSVDRSSIGGPYGNALNYICWNNYLKIRYETYYLIPYILVGPKLEFMANQGETSPDAVYPFLPAHVSLAAGAGTELVTFGKWKPFIEAFYNPDVMPAMVRPGLHVTNKNIEIRLGIKYEFHGKRESCNTPVYMEDY
jgi:hypothetical protein